MRNRLPQLRLLILVTADVLAIGLATLAALSVRALIDADIPAQFHWRIVPMLALFPFVFGALGLYPGLLLFPPEELKKLSWGISLVFLALGAAAFVSRDSHLPPRSVFLGAWLLSMVLVPLARAAVRSILARKPWWGFPVVVFGVDATTRDLLRALKLSPRIGLRPLAVHPCGGSAECEALVEGVPTVRDFESALALGAVEDSHAVVSSDRLLAVDREDLLDRLSRGFKHVLILPSSAGRASQWVTALDVGGVLGLLVRHNLLDGRRLALKRAMDICLTLAGGLLVLPACLLIALLIRLESPGPALFRQKRIGLNGKSFHVWKFRTMVPNAEEILQGCLARNPELRDEWETRQKLRHDPRVTRIGRFLRSTSLDELPQLLNVLRGDLSLVGPRPIVKSQVERYRESFSQYTRVKPGITGLWQISGRNLVSYDKRIDLDRYYINNWSIWFDIYILARTIPVVITRHGAC